MKNERNKIMMKDGEKKKVVVSKIFFILFRTNLNNFICKINIIKNITIYIK